MIHELILSISDANSFGPRASDPEHGMFLVNRINDYHDVFRHLFNRNGQVSVQQFSLKRTTKCTRF
jgi:hypothetical protein